MVFSVVKLSSKLLRDVAKHYLMGFGAIHQAPCPVPNARLPAVIRSWSSTISSPRIREQSEYPAKMMRNWSLIIVCQIVKFWYVLICFDRLRFWGAKESLLQLYHLPERFHGLRVQWPVRRTAHCPQLRRVVLCWSCCDGRWDLKVL